MKKKILCVVLSLLLVLSMGACANKEDEHNYEQEAINSESTEEADINLKLALSANENEAHYLAAQSFAEEVAGRTNGEIAIIIYGSEKLGTDKDLIKEMTENADTADIIISSVSNFTDIDVRMDVSSLPFLFKSHEEAWSFMDSDIQTEIEKNLTNQNIRVLSHYSGGFESIITSEAAIENADSMQNLSLITSEHSKLEIAMQGLGARVAVLDEGNIAQELQQGESNGYFGRLADIYENSYYLMKNNLSMTYHSYEGVAFAIAEDVWASLSEEHQKIIREAAVHSANMDRQSVRQQENDRIEEMKAAGIQVQYPDLASFKQDIQPIIKGLYTEYGNLTDRIITEYYAQ